LCQSWADRQGEGRVARGNALILCATHHPNCMGKTGLVADHLFPKAKAVGELTILRFWDGVSPECAYRWRIHASCEAMRAFVQDVTGVSPSVREAWVLAQVRL
jgi:hypothetical protein